MVNLVQQQQQPPRHTPEYLDRHTLEQMHRRTLTLLRKEIRPVGLPVYGLTHWQHLHPAARLQWRGRIAHNSATTACSAGRGGLWEGAVLPLHVLNYQSTALAACSSGDAGS